jgi:hypothetical protein
LGRKVSAAGELLTADEHEAVRLIGELVGLFRKIVGDGPNRIGDLNEFTRTIHVLQNTILAQAAARAYPDRYRLVGGVVGGASAAGMLGDTEVHLGPG